MSPLSNGAAISNRIISSRNSSPVSSSRNHPIVRHEVYPVKCLRISTTDSSSKEGSTGSMSPRLNGEHWSQNRFEQGSSFHGHLIIPGRSRNPLVYQVNRHIWTAGAFPMESILMVTVFCKTQTPPVSQAGVARVLDCFDHGPEILQGRIKLDHVRWRQDQPAALPDRPQAV